MTDVGRQVLDSALREFRAMKRQAERALEQVSGEQLNLTLDPESNSLALIVKHLAGNMRSRWTDFLTSDGEKTLSVPRGQSAAILGKPRPT